MPATKISKEEIVDIALGQFLRNGIQSVTIKQLSELIGISTKTIYRLFDDKSALLRTCLNTHYALFTNELFEISSNTENEIETYLSVIHRAAILEFGVNQKFYADLNNYYPWLQDEVFKTIGSLYTFFGDIIDQGIRNGLFLPEINTEASLIAVQTLYGSITRKNRYNDLNLSPQTLIKNTVFIYLRGMCTPLGLEKLERYELAHMTTS